jgi:hypothetical protein
MLDANSSSLFMGAGVLNLTHTNSFFLRGEFYRTDIQTSGMAGKENLLHFSFKPGHAEDCVSL